MARSTKELKVGKDELTSTEVGTSHWPGFTKEKQKVKMEERE